MSRLDRTSNGDAHVTTGPVRQGSNRSTFEIWVQPPLTVQPRDPFHNPPPQGQAYAIHPFQQRWGTDGVPISFPTLHSITIPRLGDHIPALATTSAGIHSSSAPLSSHSRIQILPPASSFMIHQQNEDMGNVQPSILTLGDWRGEQSSDDEGMQDALDHLEPVPWPYSSSPRTENRGSQGQISGSTNATPPDRRMQRARRIRNATTISRGSAPLQLPPPGHQPISRRNPSQQSRPRQPGVSRSRSSAVSRRLGRHAPVILQADASRTHRDASALGSPERQAFEPDPHSAREGAYARRLQRHAEGAPASNESPPRRRDSARHLTPGDERSARLDSFLRLIHNESGRVATSSAIESLRKVDIKDLPEDDRVCSICYNDYGVSSPEGRQEIPLRLPTCGHIFGDHCIKKWLTESDSCPYCRNKLASEPKRNQAVRHFINMMRLGIPADSPYQVSTLSQDPLHGSSEDDEETLETLLSELQNVFEAPLPQRRPNLSSPRHQAPDSNVSRREPSRPAAATTLGSNLTGNAPANSAYRAPWTVNGSVAGRHRPPNRLSEGSLPGSGRMRSVMSDRTSMPQIPPTPVPHPESNSRSWPQEPISGRSQLASEPRRLNTDWAMFPGAASPPSGVSLSENFQVGGPREPEAGDLGGWESWAEEVSRH